MLLCVPPLLTPTPQFLHFGPANKADTSHWCVPLDQPVDLPMVIKYIDWQAQARGMLGENPEKADMHPGGTVQGEMSGK